MNRPPCSAPTSGPPLMLPPRNDHSHKGDYGRVVMIGGSRGMSGSIAIAAMAALRCGSGLVSASIPDRCLETVAGFDPCVMTLPAPDTPTGRFSTLATNTILRHIASADAIGVGPGMGTGPGSIRIVRKLARMSTIPRVFDADALNVIASIGGPLLLGPAVITPHPGEMQRLSGASSRNRQGQIDAATQIAKKLGIIVLLKGPQTLVTDGDSHWFNPTGNPGMATGGSGDCLTGIITSLLGQGLSPWDSARLGAYVHGLAGDSAAEALGQPGMTASDILSHLPGAINAVTEADV